MQQYVSRRKFSGPSQIDKRIALLAVMLLMPVSTCYATDPFTTDEPLFDMGKSNVEAGSNERTVMKAQGTENDGTNNFSVENEGSQGGNKRATSKTTFKLGSLSVGGSDGAQAIELQAVSLNLALSDTYSLPMQVFYALNSPESGAAEDEQNANAANLLDPKSGVAMAIYPLVRRLKFGSKFCSFADDTKGSCMIGLELGLSHKLLDGADGKEVQAFAQTVGLRAAMKFPITGDNEKRYGALHFSPSIYYTNLDNLDDSSKLFPNIKDAAGNLIKFKEDLTFAETQIKWDFGAESGGNPLAGFAIVMKWIHPFDNKSLFKDRFSIALERKI